MNKLTVAVVTALTLSPAYACNTDEGDTSEIADQPATPTTMQQKTSFAGAQPDQFQASGGEDEPINISSLRIVVEDDSFATPEDAHETVFEPRNPSSRRSKKEFPPTPKPKGKLPPVDISKLPTPSPYKLPPVESCVEDANEEDFLRTVTLVPEINESLETGDEPDGLHRTVTGMTYKEVLESPLLDSIKRRESVGSDGDDE